ncbi:MAG: RnfABCDGE type electron transport complex subunit D, partial [Spirochaetales bacterium]|nr:RnfABCDGE type electron transport complex subunit D [Spirochaetales bacterium]
TRKGMIIYGVGAGFLTFLIRIYGSFPEGVSLAIIIMNMFVPLINRLTPPVVFGYLKEGKE